MGDMQVEKMHDEGVQLKMLQTALTLLQSPVHAHLEVCPLSPYANDAGCHAVGKLPHPEDASRGHDGAVPGNTMILRDGRFWQSLASRTASGMCSVSASGCSGTPATRTVWSAPPQPRSARWGAL